MKDLTDAVQQALKDNNYFSAMFIALSLPDICGSLETPKEKNGARAKRWFKENLGPKYMPNNRYEVMLNFRPDGIATLPPREAEKLKKEPATVRFTPEMFWSLRNAFLHEASDKNKSVKFHITHSRTPMMMINGALQLSSIEFCKDMCNAVTRWITKMQSNAIVTKRITERAKITNYINDGMYIIL
ncbi:hypothetical protein [Pantoea sp. UBA5035]|uniref:hypothetical protein n=1 Tax=Pantoea sp. UBA5035 TaxID=1947035 RepID=UPI002579865C|nr:hypothetical protein [Pantoea sp. UBA5035]